MMNDAARDRFVQLTEEDARADSTRFVNDLGQFQVTFYVWKANFEDLVRIPEAFARDFALTDLKRRPEAEALHREFVRRLHNYLAAVKSLIDHTRRFLRRWPHPDFDAQWQRKLATLRSDEVVEFVQCLRNSTMHAQLPAVKRVMRYEVGPIDPRNFPPRMRWMVSADELQQAYQWSARARGFIEASSEDGDLDLEAAVRKYHELSTALYDWFFEALARAQVSLLQDFDRRRNEIRRLLREAGAGGLTMR